MIKNAKLQITKKSSTITVKKRKIKKSPNTWESYIKKAIFIKKVSSNNNITNFSNSLSSVAKKNNLVDYDKSFYGI